VKNERELRDLVAPIFSAPTVTEGLGTTLRRVVDLTGATAGALAFRSRCPEPIVVTLGARRTPAALRDWLTTMAATPASRPQLTRIAPPGAPPSGKAALLGTIPDSELARKLARTVKAIHTMRETKGIPNRFAQVRPWTESELELLRTKPLAEVVRLTGRSLSGARWQQRQRGFKPVYQATAADEPA